MTNKEIRGKMGCWSMILIASASAGLWGFLGGVLAGAACIFLAALADAIAKGD